MKSKKALFAATIISSVLLLNACSSTDNGITTPTTTSGTPVQLGVQTSASQASTGSSQQIQNISNADQISYQVALNLKDASYCNKIQNQDYQKQCISAIADAKLTDQAISQASASLCDQETMPDDPNNCKIQVQVAQAQSQQLSQQQQDESQQQVINQQILAEDQTYMNNALKTNDPKICENISDPNTKASCQYNVYAPMAFQKNDPKLCKNITNAFLQNRCEQSSQKK